MQTIGWVLGVVAIAVVGGRGENTRDKVTKVVNSPCYKDVGGKPCQKTKQRSDEERSVASTCVLFYKVDKGGKLLRFTKCPVERSRGPSLKSNAPAASPGGGAGPTSTLQPGPRNEGSSEDVGAGKQRGSDEGGSGGRGEPTAPAPSPDPVPAESTPPGRSGDAPGNPDPPATPTGTVPATVEATGRAVGGIVEDAGRGVDCALRGCALTERP